MEHHYFANGGKYTGGWKTGKRDGEGVVVDQYGDKYPANMVCWVK